MTIYHVHMDIMGLSSHYTVLPCTKSPCSLTGAIILDSLSYTSYPPQFIKYVCKG